MATSNIEVRRKAKRNGVRMWQIAERLGVFDSNLSRMLRKELPPEKKEQILRIIDDLAKEDDALWQNGKC